MRRPLAEIEREQAAEQLELAIKEHSNRKRRGSASAGPAFVARVKAEAGKMREDRDWSKASPRHLVMLHAMLHEHVYGVVPDSERGKEFAFAASAAARMLKGDFDEDAEAMVDYLRWSWQREQDREEWRRKNGREGGRLDWRRQFAQRCVLTDYRVDQARKKGAA